MCNLRENKTTWQKCQEGVLCPHFVTWHCPQNADGRLISVASSITPRACREPVCCCGHAAQNYVKRYRHFKMLKKWAFKTQHCQGILRRPSFNFLERAAAKSVWETISASPGKYHTVTCQTGSGGAGTEEGEQVASSSRWDVPLRRD